MLAGAALLAGACASTTPGAVPVSPAPAARAAVPPPAVPSEVFESEDFIVTVLRADETSATLAARHLGDAGRAWMIEDYNRARTFAAGQQVVVPRRPWNLSGVEASGYQIVPILVYHNLGPQAKGRLVLAARMFEQQMRYLKAEGYRVVTLKEFIEWTRLARQLPRRSVVLTFDDGYKAFREHAYPVLKELGFPATLFVYTDYVGAGRNALTWIELRELAREGFDVQAHSKTHADLRRAAGEGAPQYARRMKAELAQPLDLFRAQIGRSVEALAYPYGWTDEELVRQVQASGYTAAFTVRRQANAPFVSPFAIHRSQIYAEMSLEEFARNLTVFHDENLVR